MGVPITTREFHSGSQGSGEGSRGMKIDASTRPQHRDLSVPGAYNTKATGRSEGAKNWAAAQAPAGRADDEYKRRMLESTVATLEQGGEAVNKLTLTISAQQQRRRQQQASAEADPSICGVSNDRTTPIEAYGGNTVSAPLDQKRARPAPPPGESHHDDTLANSTNTNQTASPVSPSTTTATTAGPVAGGDPYPSCSSSASIGNPFSETCQCGWANAEDKAREGFTGGEPVAAARVYCFAPARASINRVGSEITGRVGVSTVGGVTGGVVFQGLVGFQENGISPGAFAPQVMGGGGGGGIGTGGMPMPGVNGVGAFLGPQQQQRQHDLHEAEDRMVVDVGAEGAAGVLTREPPHQTVGRIVARASVPATAAAAGALPGALPVSSTKTSAVTGTQGNAHPSAGGVYAGLEVGEATRERVVGAQVMIKSEDNGHHHHHGGVNGGSQLSLITTDSVAWTQEQCEQVQQQKQQFLQLQAEVAAATGAGFEMMMWGDSNGVMADTRDCLGLLSQTDTMDRLAQSLAQAQQLSILVETRQTELLARPKRRPHPSAKQESASQSRKVRPKNCTTPAASDDASNATTTILTFPTKEDVSSASTENVRTAHLELATFNATSLVGSAAPDTGLDTKQPNGKAKQRLTIKIPRRVVTAATINAEAAAAVKEAEKAVGKAAGGKAGEKFSGKAGAKSPGKNSGKAGGKGKGAGKAGVKGAGKAADKNAAEKLPREETSSKRGGKGVGKGGGVKRARPLAGTRAPPPPPPPAPTSRQELPPGCGPPSPGLRGIFGREMEESELDSATDGPEHMAASIASKRLTALSSANPKELASHIQALRLDYLVQKVRPILTKLMSAGTGPQRGLFNVPVDPVKLGIPDYFKRVPHPMDLGTIKARLLSMKYTTPEAFAADVRLVFNNAIGFNPQSHFVHTWAVHLLNEFDQEYHKQLGKLDENWAKSLSHSCQLCQGQTCTLCGDKCLKLEPPVIICQHCNKRVVRGGVYHITRDGCRLWCSRCHPGLPPELPIDCDPETLAGSEGGDAEPAAVGDGGEEGASAGGVDNAGPAGVVGDRMGACSRESTDSNLQGGSGSQGGPREGSGPPSVVSAGGCKGARSAAAGNANVTSTSSHTANQATVSCSPSQFTSRRPSSSIVTATAAPAGDSSLAQSALTVASAAGVEALPLSSSAPPAATALTAGEPTATGTEHTPAAGSDVSGSPAASTACEAGARPREATDVSERSAEADGREDVGVDGSEADTGAGLGAAVPLVVVRGGSSGGERGTSEPEGAAPAPATKAEVEAQVPEAPALRKRDLLRRKFDEEISEPWVQCDRCNSWVHQVCALFNARSNVGEATFVCPLCRLGAVSVVGSEPSLLSRAEDHYAVRKRSQPDSLERNTHESPSKVAKTGGDGISPADASVPAAAAAARNDPARANSETADAATVATVAILVSPLVGGGLRPMTCCVDNGESPIVAVPSAMSVNSQANEVVGAQPSPTARAGDGDGAGMRSPDTAVSALACTTTTSPQAATAAAGAPLIATRGPAAPDATGAGVVLDSSSPAENELLMAGSSSLPCGVQDESEAEVQPVLLPSQSASASAASAAGPVVGAQGSPPAGGDASGATSSVGGAGGAAATLAEKMEDTSAKRDEAVSGIGGASAGGRFSIDVDGGADAGRGVEGTNVERKEKVGMGAGVKAAETADTGGPSDDVDVYAASSLPHTPLSRYIEHRVRQRLAKLEDRKAAETLIIRLISNVEATCEVHPVLRETFCCKEGLGVGPNKNEVPELLTYRSKALSMFQRVDGVEVCLFSMYVQEYGADAPYFNARRAYISYLDSVEYFRPRKHRTAAYHEILVAYLDWLRRRGFKAAHIWSCPPQRGNNFIFWCHPLHQKTPTRDRLSGWYGNMLKRAVHLGVAAKVTTLDKTHFAEVEKIGILLKNRRTSAAASAAASLAGVKGPDDLPLRPEVPVIFEGDFWAEEAVRLARQVDRRDEGTEDIQSPLDICRQALEELIKHQQGAPFTAPVDPARDRCPDYLMVIKTPMDLGTVAETLDRMQYHDAGAFVSDVRLIFENAKKYNPPKHPIHIAAAKLSKLFDKTVRALESAVNRLPGMHDMGLENLLLEEPPPPTPTTPAAGATTPGGAAAAAAAAAATAAAAAAAARGIRPTAPGKSSIPWAHDAIGPLSQLARQTWAAHTARTARAVGTLPPMMEDSSMYVAASMPSHAPSHWRTLGGSVGIGGGSSSNDLYSDSLASGPERLSRTGSTAVMSVSEFYGPSGARMLQRRGSTASALSLADSYGETEVEGSGGGAGRDNADGLQELREGEEALSMLIADVAEVDGRSGEDSGGVCSSGAGGDGGAMGSDRSTQRPAPESTTDDTQTTNAALLRAGANTVSPVETTSIADFDTGAAPAVVGPPVVVDGSIGNGVAQNHQAPHAESDAVLQVEAPLVNGEHTGPARRWQQTPLPSPQAPRDGDKPRSDFPVAFSSAAVDPSPAPALAGLMASPGLEEGTKTVGWVSGGVSGVIVPQPTEAAAAARPAEAVTIPTLASDDASIASTFAPRTDYAAKPGACDAIAAQPPSASPPLASNDPAAKSLPPPLTLDPPHPMSAAGGANGVGTAAGSVAAAALRSGRAPWVVTPPSSGSGGGEASLATATPGAVNLLMRQNSCELQQLDGSDQQQQQALSRSLRAMSVDSASPTFSEEDANHDRNTFFNARTRTMSMGAVPSVSSHAYRGNHTPFIPSPVGSGRAGSRSDSFGLTNGVERVSVLGLGSSGSSVTSLAAGGAHSPRLRAQSMDLAAAKGRKKGKSKRGKGPGASVMGKADRIGRMLQSLSRAVTRISKDLLVVSLGEPDRPARPPPARAGSGTTTGAMLAELQEWHAASGLDGVLTADCHDPDPPISRALVDARHTFLEMCQFRHYQFDTLRRAKHSSAMVLYHLHRPESRSLNPFCSRCHRPVRFVRYHCGVCNYDLCSACDEEVGTKCEDGHDLTPYRVTFSTEDAEKSPAAGRTSATGGTSLSPLRRSRPDTAPASTPSGGRSGTLCTDRSSATNGADAPAPATRANVEGGPIVPHIYSTVDDRLCSTSPPPAFEAAEENAGAGSEHSRADSGGACGVGREPVTSTALGFLSTSLTSMDVFNDEGAAASAAASPRGEAHGVAKDRSPSNVDHAEFILRTPRDDACLVDNGGDGGGDAGRTPMTMASGSAVDGARVARGRESAVANRAGGGCP